MKNLLFLALIFAVPFAQKNLPPVCPLAYATAYAAGLNKFTGAILRIYV
jgi:hypothetical protein